MTTLNLSLLVSVCIIVILGCGDSASNKTNTISKNHKVSVKNEVSGSLYKKIDLQEIVPKKIHIYDFGQEVFRFKDLVFGLGQKRVSVKGGLDSGNVEFFVVYDTLGIPVFEKQLTFPYDDARIFFTGFYYSENSGRLIIDCGVGTTDYFFADMFFLIENHKVYKMGETELATMNEDVLIADILQFSDSNDSIFIDFLADSLFVDYGSDYGKTISTSDIQISYDLRTETLNHFFYGVRTNSILDFLFPENIDSMASKVFVGWRVMDKTLGDINLDGLDDLVLVVQENDSTKIKAGEYGEFTDLNPRVLLVYFQNENGYSKHLQKRHFIPIKDNINMEDPLGEIAIDSNNVLTIRFRYFMTAGSYYTRTETFKFRYENEDIRLIGFDDFSFTRNFGTSDLISCNFITQRYQYLRENMFHTQEEVPEDYSETWGDLNWPYPILLKSINEGFGVEENGRLK